MIVQLERVVFDHVAGATVDGLSVRIDRDRPALDWIRGAADPSVAAYALAQIRNRPLTIRAQFSFHDLTALPGNSVTVRANATDPANAPVGAVAPTVVAIPSASPNMVSLLVPLPLASVHLQSLGIGKYPLTLRWQFQVGTGSAFVDFAASDHIVYVTLDLPGPPWTQATSAAEQLRWPWTRALDWSCAWAQGITFDGNLSAAIDRVARRIETQVNKLGQRKDVPVQYQDSGAGGAYATEYPPHGAFLCTNFLRLLEGDTAPEIDTQVDCSDCAAAVVVFANVLGCDLVSNRVAHTQSAFDTNRVVAIGRTDDKPKGYPFGYHEVAGRRRSVSSFRVFDACLRIDRDADPASAKVHTFGLSRGLTLTSATLQPVRLKYVHRLIKKEDWEDLTTADVPVRCLEQCDASLAAPLDQVTIELHQNFFKLIKVSMPGDPGPGIPVDLSPIPLPGYVAYHTDAKTPQFAAMGPLLVRSVDSYYVALPPDRRHVMKEGRADDRKRPVTKSASSDTRLRLSMAFARTPTEARDALAWVLAQSAIRLSLRTTDGKPIVGDAGFTGPRDGSVCFVRGNLIARLMNTGRDPAKLLDLATAVDVEVTRRLTRRGGPPPSAR